ncbi:hypothetical protein IC582_015680 [Cucumis melo]
MASSSFLLLISLLLLLLPFHSDADLHKTRLRQSDLFSESHVSTTADHSTPPTVFFEVTKPIVTPKAKPCSLLVLHHDFAYTYGKPPVLADYTPPSHCSFTKFSKIVLEWKATCRGRQFDRIFGVWLGGVEILRSCTAEPRATGIVWTVQKDITREDLNFTGADGTFLTKVTRSVSSAGWVKSSFGTITTLSNQDLSYSNLMMMGNNGSSQTVNQEIHFNSSVYAKQESSHVYSSKTLKTFPLYMYSNTIDQGNGSYRSIANLTLGFNEKKTDGLGSFISSLKNVQNGQGLMVVKGNLVTSGLGSTQQDYRYYDDVQCYSRSISSSNYTILHDNVKNMCGEKQNSSESLRFRRWPIPARRASLDSNLFVNNGHV